MCEQLMHDELLDVDRTSWFFCVIARESPCQTREFEEADRRLAAVSIV